MITISGGPSARPRDPEGAASSSLGPVLLGLAALAVLLVAALGQRPPPPVAPPVDAALRLVAEDLTVSQGGVLVVPVVLQDHGPGHRVLSAGTYAEPVRTDPYATPPDAVAPGDARRFVVLLAPDCRLLGPRSGLEFRASLLLQVGNGRASQQLVLDIGTDPVVRARVQGLCGRS